MELNLKLCCLLLHNLVFYYGAMKRDLIPGFRYITSLALFLIRPHYPRTLSSDLHLITLGIDMSKRSRRRGHSRAAINGIC